EINWFRNGSRGARAQTALPGPAATPGFGTPGEQAAPFRNHLVPARRRAERQHGDSRWVRLPGRLRQLTSAPRRPAARGVPRAPGPAASDFPAAHVEDPFLRNRADAPER